MAKTNSIMSQSRREWQNGLTNRMFNRTGYTGRILEREVLGECRVGCDGYMHFEPAMKLAERNQPYQSNNPPPEVANFHRAVAAEMGINPRDLHVFTAVGTALDRFHGIDGWFRYNDRIVTVDVTMNPHKLVSEKADVVVTKVDADLGYQLAAMEIAEKFKRIQVLGTRTGVA